MSVPRTHADTRAYWQRQVDAWRDSGLSKAAFCRESGVHPASFSQWSRRFLSPTAMPAPKAATSAPSSASESLVMIPVSLVGEPDGAAERSSSQNVIVNRADITLTLPTTLEPEQIGHWLGSLALCDVQR